MPRLKILKPGCAIGGSNNFTGSIRIAELLMKLNLYLNFLVYTGIVDQSGKTGQFILSGSQSFLLHDRISQSLAGRTAIFRLLPLSFSELRKADQLVPSTKQIFSRAFSPGFMIKR